LLAVSLIGAMAFLTEVLVRWRGIGALLKDPSSIYGWRVVILVVSRLSELNSVQPLTFLSENVIVTQTRVQIPSMG
jgi:hypothetical protein